MPPTLKNQAQIPVPPAVRPFVRAAQVNLLVFAIAFYITFKYFWDGSISGLGFGVIVAALLAVYLAVGQGLRVAVRKRRSELTAAETSDLARHSLDVFRKQKSRAIFCCVSLLLALLSHWCGHFFTGNSVQSYLFPSPFYRSGSLMCGPSTGLF